MVHVSELYTYPIKSGAAESVAETIVYPYGFLGDRRFVIIRTDVPDGKDNFVSQRLSDCEKMTQIRLTPDYQIQIGHQGVKYALDETDEMRTVRIHGRETLGEDCGDDVANALSQYLGRNVRLVQMVDGSITSVDEKYTPDAGVVFADGYPFLITSEASLQALNKDADFEIPMENFRSNIILGGKDLLAYEEDAVERISIGGIEFELVSPCSRCVIPNIDQEIGVKDRNLSVTKRLNEFRRTTAGPDNRPATYFGWNAVAKNLVQGKIKQIAVGAKVEIIQKRDRPHTSLRDIKQTYPGFMLG